MSPSKASLRRVSFLRHRRHFENVVSGFFLLLADVHACGPWAESESKEVRGTGPCLLTGQQLKNC